MSIKFRKKQPVVFLSLLCFNLFRKKEDAVEPKKIKDDDNVDFINLILMLNQNALISLGEAARFVGGMKNANLPHARQAISMLKAIQEKSKNNLTAGETKLLFRLLGDLQAKYVKAAGLDKTYAQKSPEEKKKQDNVLHSALDKMDDNALASLLSELKKQSNDKGK